MPRNDFEDDFVWSRSSRIIPSSPELLQEAEKSLMVLVQSPYVSKYVDIGDNKKLWTYIFNEEAHDRTPLVMVHGFAGGIALWCLNFDELSKNRPVYAFDLLGFARSTRSKFSSDPLLVEEEFVQSIEDWRKANNIHKMILLGHSFGGFLVSSYALKHPQNIQHLILVDPWGFQEFDADDPERRPIPIWLRGIVKVLSVGNPLSPIRCLGPCGPKAIVKVRKDIGERFESKGCKKKDPLMYIYHCNAQKPTGEEAFKQLVHQIGYAKNPMMKRICALEEDLPVSFIYGENTWMDKRCAETIKETLGENQVEIYCIENAAHHVYVDQPDEYHHVVNSICDKSESD